MVRGLVIVIMALDHVRDFFLQATSIDPLADPNVPPALFLTRWITHFCAPVFVFLAGTSAGLMVARKSSNDLTRFLLTRGLWLLVVECVLISTSATFAPRGVPEFGGAIILIMQVIWAISVSMIALSLFSRFGRRTCLVLGAAIVVGHNLLDPVWPVTSMFDRQWPAWVALHGQISVQAGPFLIVFIYPVLAWIGVMLVGFGSSAIFELPTPRRNQALLRVGLAVTAAFIVLRLLDVYGDPNPWQQHSTVTSTVIDFLNTTKYPPSLLFLLMTLGPAAILCAVADRAPSVVKSVFVIYGRVPFAFYVTHFYVIHLLSILLGLAQGFQLRQLLTIFFLYPKGYGISLPGVYAVWLFVVLLLYPLCRWMSALKARRRDWWLSYV
jgi:uncharacterized membrane protein